MGTEKRERQKANRAQRQVEEAKAERAGVMKRNALRWGIGAILAIGAVVLIAWVGGAFSGDDEGDVETGTTDAVEAFDDGSDSAAATEATAMTDDGADTTDDAAADASDDAAADADADADADAPTSVPEQAPASDCPATDGSEEPQQTFTEPQPFCIDVTTTYTAEISTNLGDMTAELFDDVAPLTVNNFVTLANYHYFDGVPCHRIIPGFMAQCGDPTGTGRGGPGYAFPDELPEAGEYRVGSLAMANSGPDTNGSQFFIITGAQGEALPPDYTLFGQVIDGLDTTLPAIDAVGNPEGNGVPPLEPVDLESVTITES